MASPALTLLLLSLTLFLAGGLALALFFMPEILPSSLHDFLSMRARSSSRRRSAQKQQEQQKKQNKQNKQVVRRSSRRESSKRYSVDKHGHRFYREKLRFEDGTAVVDAGQRERALLAGMEEVEEVLAVANGGERESERVGAASSAKNSAKARMIGAMKGVGAIVASPMIVGGIAAEKTGSLIAASKAQGNHAEGTRSSRKGHGGGGRNAKKVVVDPARGLRAQVEQIQYHRFLKVTLFEHQDLTTCATFSPHGQFVATAGGPEDPVVRLMVRRTLGMSDSLVRMQTIQLPVDDWPASIAFSAVDSFFLVVGTGQSGHIAVYRVFRQISRKPQVELHYLSGHSSPVRQLFMSAVPTSPDDFLVMTGGSSKDNLIKVWSYGKKAKLVYEKEFSSLKEISQVRFARGGKSLAVIGPAKEQPEPEDGEPNTPVCAVSLMDVRFSNRGAFKKTWTVDSIEKSPIDLKDTAKANDLQFCQRSHHLVSISGDSWILWKMRESRLVQLAFLPSTRSQPFQSVAFSELQQSVVASKGRDIFIYSLNSENTLPKLVSLIENAHDSDIVEIQISPEEDSFLTLGANSSSARIWHLSS